MPPVTQPTGEAVVPFTMHCVAMLGADGEQMEGYAKTDLRVSTDVIRQHQPPASLLQFGHGLAVPFLSHLRLSTN